MGIITQRYTKALYELSDVQDICDRIQQDLRQINQWLNSNEDVLRLIKSLVVPRKEAVLALNALCQKAQFHELTTNFLKLLATQRRLKYLPGIVDSFDHKMDMRAGLIKGQLVTATPVTKTQSAALERHLSSKLNAQVHLANEVDHTLLGGFIVRIGFYLVDSCLNTQLTNIQNVLKGKK